MKCNLAIILFIITLPKILLSQCYPDRHNTSWSDSWISCEPRKSPNSNRGLSHWILYDLGEVYPLGKMHLWNLNIPGEENSGVKSMEIDYLVDQNKSDWSNLGTFKVEKGPGSSIYEGEEVADWDGVQARFVLLTFPENYGGKCTGFSEVKFNLREAQVMTDTSPETNTSLSAQAYPNPFKNNFTLTIQSESEDKIRYKLVNVLGQIVINQQISFQGQERIDINTSKLPAGNFFLLVEQGELRISKSLIHIP